MAEKGYRKVQSHGQVSIPKEFREDNDIEQGDEIYWKRHSKDKSKIIISAEEE